MKKIFKSSLIRKQLIIFMIIIGINILGIFGMYKWAKENIEVQIKEKLYTQNEYFLTDLSNEIDRIQHLQYNIFADKYMVLLNSEEEVLSNYERREAILSLQDKILAIKLSNKYIKDVKVYLNKAKLNISAEDVDETSEKEIKDLKKIIKDNEGILKFYEDRVYCIATNYDTGKNDMIPSAVVLVEFSKEEIMMTLHGFKHNESTGVIVQGADNEWCFEEFMGELERKVAMQLIDRKGKGTGKLENIQIEKESYFLVESYSASLGMKLSQFHSYTEVFGIIEQAKNYFIGVVVLTCMIILLFSGYTYRAIHKPILNLQRAFEEVEKGNLEVFINYHKKDEFKYIYTRFNGMVLKLKSLIKEVYEYKDLVQQSELKQLQAQINPHFLYNSFFTLSRKIKRGDSESAITFTNQLGYYFKFITRNGAPEVGLQAEVDHAKSYADIQAMRFVGRIEVDFGVLPDQYKEVWVPRLILQPIIENAFEHSLENKEEGGILKVRFIEEKEHLEIVVEDNGETLSEEEIYQINESLGKHEEQKEITGLFNIHRRLKIFFGEESGLVFRRSNLGGLAVSIRLQHGGRKDV